METEKRKGVERDGRGQGIIGGKEKRCDKEKNVFIGILLFLKDCMAGCKTIHTEPTPQSRGAPRPALSLLLLAGCQADQREAQRS